MPSTFHGLNTSYLGIAAHQTSLYTVGHNIANANTEGYSRQEAVHASTFPYTMPGLNTPGGAGQIGSGVEIDVVRQIRDTFLDTQYRKENTASGTWDPILEALENAEYIVNEPSESSLSTAINEFWQSLEELGDDPGSSVARSLVTQKASSLTDTLNYISTSFLNMRSDYDELLAGSGGILEGNDYASTGNEDQGGVIGQLNSKTAQIAELNKMIKKIESDPDLRANDLRDKRNLLIDEISNMVNSTATERADGTVDLTVNGMPLVKGDTSNKIIAVKIADPTDPENPNAAKYTELRWEDGTKFEPTSGYIAGIIEVRDNIAVSYLEEFDTIAKSLYTGINMLQKAGYALNEESAKKDHVDNFFIIDPKDVNNQYFASKITVNPKIMGTETNLNRIAAASIPSNSTSGISNYENGVNAFNMSMVVQSAFVGGQITLVDEPDSRYFKVKDILNWQDVVSPEVFSVVNTGSPNGITGRVTMSEPIYYANGSEFDPLVSGTDISADFSYTRNGVTVSGLTAGRAMYTVNTGIPTIDFDFDIALDANIAAGIPAPPQVGDKIVLNDTGVTDWAFDESGNKYKPLSAEYTADGWVYSWPKADKQLQVYKNGIVDVTVSDPYLKYNTNGDLKAYVTDATGVEHEYSIKIENGSSFEDAFDKSLERLGVETDEAQKNVDNQTLLLETVDNLRLQVMGVSLDEEMTNMIKFQQGYNASARMLTTFDEMLETIISRMGRVGA